MQHRQSITDSSHSASPERMDSWQRVMQTDRAHPGQPTTKVTPVSGRALVPEQQMVVKWWPIITHPTEKMAVLCRKRCVGILLFAVHKFFLRNVSMSKYCFVTAEVFHNLVWGCTSGSVLHKLPPLSLKIGRVSDRVFPNLVVFYRIKS